MRAALLFILIASSMLAVCIPVPVRPSRKPVQTPTTLRPLKSNGPIQVPQEAQARKRNKKPRRTVTVIVDKTGKTTGSDAPTVFPLDVKARAITLAINRAMGSTAPTDYIGLYTPSKESGERDMFFFKVDEEGRGPYFGWAAKGAAFRKDSKTGLVVSNGELAGTYAGVGSGDPATEETFKAVPPPESDDAREQEKRKDWGTLSIMFDEIFMKVHTERPSTSSSVSSTFSKSKVWDDLPPLLPSDYPI
ncbi:hypothetical protein BDP27DRAFT_1430962 [Rhodocollybia butyracea]|uniref:Uncharacterized protein n=1 Tax=Rhodocollybia butyracea TaxID=206335 RepID=A0A9P5TYD9_9AGAR|nr:hypothetical protein BDP27DRAFT_1430962 [Rhodocollybia butyracea]